MAEMLVNGARIAWQQLGEGPDLVLVHGLAASRAFWFAQYALPLQQHYRVTLFDLRGHGYSERTPAGYSATALANDLAGLLDQAGIDRCLLAGHSYGGGVALELACAQPERVAGLCVMDTKVNALQPQQKLSDMPYLSPFEIEVARASGIDWQREEQIGLRFLEVVARLKAASQEVATRDAVTPFGEGRGAARTAKAWIELIDTPGVREELLRAGAPAARIRESLQSLPVLLLYGELSRCMPSCERLRALLPRAETHIVEGGGHFFPLSHAATVRPRMEEFFEQAWSAV